MDAIDLYAARFWSFVALALLVLVPLTGPSARKWAFAALNIGFLAIHTRPGETITLVGVVGGVLVAWLALSRAGRAVPGTAWVVGLGIFALFLLHKMPHLGSRLGTTRAESVLAAVGFSYVALRMIDVARAVREGREAPDFPSTINYLLPFHMLAAGPIQSYDDFVAQPAVPPPLSPSRSLLAFERIAQGLFKKFILAGLIDRMFLTGFRAPMPYFLVEMNLNYLWLYLDFSAYTDVAVGIGLLMGVATPENFNRPYLARNLVEYWERWHISLSQFIRRNLFIPIQMALIRRTEGGRPLLAASIAFSVSFLLCGLWHSVSLPWLAWGACQSAGLIACTWYKQFLVDRLGRKGVKQYLANPWIRLAAIAVTFEFAAAVVAVATYPFPEMSWWTESRN